MSGRRKLKFAADTWQLTGGSWRIGHDATIRNVAHRDIYQSSIEPVEIRTSWQHNMAASHRPEAGISGGVQGTTSPFWW